MIMRSARSREDVTVAVANLYEGAINGANTAKSVALTLEAGTKWVLTGDSYLSALDGDTSGIDLNGHTLYVGGVAWAK